MAAKYKKRPDGRYMTHVIVGTQEDGKPKRKTVYARTIRELEEKAAELRRQVSTGTLITDESVLVSTWADEWLNTYKSSVEYNTRRMYEMVIRAHIKPNIGMLKLKDVRPHHIQKMINEKGATRTAEKIVITVIVTKV